MAEKDYIEREAAINAVYEAYADGESAYDALENLPAADVRPVVRGRWVTRPYMMGKTEYCSRWGENYGRKHNFCPNCGADMRET